MTRTATQEEQEREWFIEQVGDVCESDGFTHIAGRMFGLLLLSAAPCSLDDMAEILSVSKASASTEARRLLKRDIVLRHSLEGDRRDYYEIAPDFFEALMHVRVSHWSRMRQLATAALERVPDLPPLVQDRLSYVNTASDFCLELIDGALAQWNERVTGQTQPRARKSVTRRKRPS